MKEHHQSPLTWMIVAAVLLCGFVVFVAPKPRVAATPAQSVVVSQPTPAPLATPPQNPRNLSKEVLEKHWDDPSMSAEDLERAFKPVNRTVQLMKDIPFREEAPEISDEEYEQVQRIEKGEILEW